MKPSRYLHRRRWTRIQRVRKRADYAEFRAAYDEICAAVLAEVPAPSKDWVRAAFALEETCYLLYRRIRQHRPTKVVETGTFLGLSAMVCASALRRNHTESGVAGQVYSISLDSFYRIDHPLRRAAATCRRLGLSDYATFLEGSSGPMNSMESPHDDVTRGRLEYVRKRILPENRTALLHRLAATLGEVDLAYLDALHYETSQMTDICALLGNLSASGAVFVDDALISGRREDLRALASSLVRFDWSLRRLIDFFRAGFRFYQVPWIVDAFRWSNLVRMTWFKSKGRTLRIILLEPEASYRSPSGPLGTWYSDETLVEFVERFRVRPAPAGADGKAGEVASGLRVAH